MRSSMEEHDALVVEDLVDHAEVPAPSGIEALELAAKRLPRPPWIDGDRVKDRSEHRVSDLMRQLVEMASRLRSRLDCVRLAPLATGYFGRSSFERLPAAACLRECRIERVNSSS